MHLLHFERIAAYCYRNETPMITLKTEESIREWIGSRKQEGKSIGFVPTMGALHKGHLSLAEASKEENDYTIVSIFVNPRQFNDPQDLIKYPRPIEEDKQLLEEINIDILFLPDVEDIYPPDVDAGIDFDPGPAAQTMEGQFRPGHFKGMAEVVYRLLSIVEPHKLYMGQKDFQQFSIVRKMITDMDLPVAIEMCPTVREPNGLAMSSRNERLSPDAREDAAIIYATLVDSQRMFEEGEDVDIVKKEAINALTLPDFEPEYFEIVDGVSLKPITSMLDSQFIVACCAVRVEGVRLIDNAIWTRPE